MKKKNKTLSGIFGLAAASAIAATMAFSAPAMAETDGAQAATLDDSALTEVVEARQNGTDIPFNVLASGQPVFAQAAPDNTAVETTATTAEASSNDSGMQVGPLTFLQPWMLLGLGALPFLWFLMRSVPPRPREVDFPAIRFLMDLEDKDQQPHRMPLWQRLLGLTAAGALVLGAANPTLNPDTPLEGEGPVMIVVDNGWASASDWTSRTQEMERVITLAEKDGRQIILVPTATDENGSPVRASGILDADDARDALAEIQPQPWPVDREAALAAVASLELSQSPTIFWLSNGLNDSGALALAEALQNMGQLTVFEDEPEDTPMLLLPPAASGADMTVTVQRANAEEAQTVILTATDLQGRALKQIEIELERGQTEAEAVIDLPSELRNEITRVSINGENSAGGVVLLDERWKRRPVGVVEVSSSLSGQPLLEETHYIRRAVDPYVDLFEGDLNELLDRELSVLIMTDDIAITPQQRERLDQWVKDGGTLLRFAGPRLADQPEDNLVPVTLRQGERELGGELSGTPQGVLAPFEEDSPFYGTDINTSVTVDRQVFAEPGPELESRTWAELEDGSPLVTGARNGEGWLVLVHTTADADWSNLALSGVFVDMMRAVVSQSQGISDAAQADETRAAPPLQALNAQGQLSDPSSAARPLRSSDILAGDVSAEHPPGYYGNESAQQAHNLATGVSDLEALGDLPDGATRAEYTGGETEDDLSGPLLAGGLALMLAYWGVLMAQQGHLPSGPGRRRKDKAPKPS